MTLNQIYSSKIWWYNSATDTKRTDAEGIEGFLIVQKTRILKNLKIDNHSEMSKKYSSINAVRCWSCKKEVSFCNSFFTISIWRSTKVSAEGRLCLVVDRSHHTTASFAQQFPSSIILSMCVHGLSENVLVSTRSIATFCLVEPRCFLTTRIEWKQSTVIGKAAKVVCNKLAPDRIWTAPSVLHVKHATDTSQELAINTVQLILLKHKPLHGVYF